jgi:hypothetical protein
MPVKKSKAKTTKPKKSVPERILTKHPEAGKSGRNIRKETYDTIKEAIISILKKEKEVAFYPLGHKVEKQVKGKVAGKVLWFYVTVKLDLEARGILMRVPGTSPQMVRLKK